MKISVIIPCFNQEELVIRAIDSIPKRDDIEIIVIDDGSDDGTWNSLQEYYNSHLDMENLFLVKNDENKGVGYTVNRGYDLAKGEYVILLGSDDYFYTDKFEEIIPKLDGTDLVYFDMKINNGDVWEINNDSKMILVGSVKFMRREFLDDIRCDEIKSGEDKYFYWRLLEKKPTEKFTHIVLKHYNHPREGSLTDLVEKGVLPRVQ